MTKLGCFGKVHPSLNSKRPLFVTGFGEFVLDNFEFPQS